MKRWVAVAFVGLAAASIPPAQAVEPIRVCAHAPITGAAPIPRHPERFGQFYFDAVNAEQGGVDGRPVRMLVYDDQYYPAGARAAAERCLRDGADLYVGFSAHDLMMSVARWADRKDVPYLHGSLPRALAEEIDGDGSFAPTPEEFAQGLADVLVANASEIAGHSPPVFGMVVTHSPFYEDQVDAFRSALEARGHELAIVIPVQRDETAYARAYAELMTRGVTMVNMATSSALTTRMIAQRPPSYDPLFASSEPGAGMNRVATAAGSARLLVLNDPSPAYDADDPDDRYADEIEEFHRVFDTYSAEQAPPRDDFDWMMYVRARQIHGMLDALDGDITPNGFFELFESYTETPAGAFPACALDFATDPTFGQRSWHVLANEGGRFVQRAMCSDASARSDVIAPSIACADLVAMEAVNCSFEDSRSGIGAFEISAEPLSGEPVVVTGNGACDTAVDEAVTLDPGVYRLSVSVLDCSGLVAEAAAATVVI